MLWTLLSIVAAFGELIAFMSTDWLVGYPRTPDAVFGSHGTTAAGEAYRPTLGIYGRCIKLPHTQRGILCGPYAIHFGEIASGFWQATSIFLAAGILLLCAVAFISVFTMCFQSIMKKSIFNVCGLLQGIAGKVIVLSCDCLEVFVGKIAHDSLDALRTQSLGLLVLSQTENLY